MLRKLLHAALLVLAVFMVSSMTPPDSMANGCTTAKSGVRYGADTVSVSAGSPGSSGGQGSVTGCTRSDGVAIVCRVGDFQWTPRLDAYCKMTVIARDSLLLAEHVDGGGDPQDSAYYCLVSPTGSAVVLRWLSNNSLAHSADPESLVRSAVSSMGLHPPTVGVGAFVYPRYTQWGLTWWVGAPMWLWVDTTDSYQWGIHSLSASVPGMSVSATVKPTSVRFDPGDGTLVSCRNAGTPRVWNPNDLMADHSPTRCEHTYLQTNKLGDKDSRYLVSAYVVWTVTWSSSDGQTGSFTLTVNSVSPASIHVGELRVVRVEPPPR
jgi:hypothetical protein